MSTPIAPPREPLEIVERMQTDLVELRQVLLKPEHTTAQMRAAALGRAKTLGAILGVLKQVLSSKGRTFDS